MPVQKMKPIRGTSIEATLKHMAQILEKIERSPRKVDFDEDTPALKMVKSGIKTYNKKIAADLIEHYGTQGGTPVRWVGRGCEHFNIESKSEVLGNVVGAETFQSICSIQPPPASATAARHSSST